MNRLSFRKLALGVLTLVLFILGWKLVTDARLISPIFFPGPERTYAALVKGLSGGPLLAQTVETVERMLYGWLLASAVGVLLGALIGISRRARAFIAPTLELLRPLPASAMIPVAIAFLGFSDQMVLVVIAFGALWPMLLATIHGFAAMEPRLYEVSAVLGLSRFQVIWKLALPSAMPMILASLRLGLTISLVLAVVGEMLASRAGLGQSILAASRSFRSADLFAGIVILGAIGLCGSRLLSMAERRLLRWQAVHR
ncbi:ABC-type nitrate/sulfonate/bicarbonate transport system, permease component [Rhizobium sp. RU35A]|uniref:ABC transporter permease n=1 Tax=Rhizobium straminoryzae TaxID=1387186 RepID=A0A549SZ34_9HYPH|nr:MULTISPECIES: ABC transporter permease [Rhizobium]TRL34892.1 ABC transporter permease [Rhizobium straminoryzae]SIQ43159.1 ABC-type nitrate/sulfonate/bicarbonate transport system, permease component [Rhizobium sp. RU35A]